MEAGLPGARSLAVIERTSGVTAHNLRIVQRLAPAPHNRTVRNRDTLVSHRHFRNKAPQIIPRPRTWLGAPSLVDSLFEVSPALGLSALDKLLKSKI